MTNCIYIDVNRPCPPSAEVNTIGKGQASKKQIVCFVLQEDSGGVFGLDCMNGLIFSPNLPFIINFNSNFQCQILHGHYRLWHFTKA